MWGIWGMVWWVMGGGVIVVRQLRCGVYKKIGAVRQADFEKVPQEKTIL